MYSIHTTGTIFNGHDSGLNRAITQPSRGSVPIRLLMVADSPDNQVPAPGCGYPINALRIVANLIGGKFP